MIAEEEDPDEPVLNRCPTKENPPVLVGSIDVDLSIDADAREAAALMGDLYARIMRSGKRLRITIEAIDE